LIDQPISNAEHGCAKSPSDLRRDVNHLVLRALRDLDRRRNWEIDLSQDIPKKGAECASDGTWLQVKEPQDMSATLIQVNSQVEQALRQSAIPALRRLAVEETETTVVILGRVGSYYMKQLAQETVMPVRGERQVENRVLVDGE
jgi:osmotically-inducible protein OsmY